MLVQFLLFGMMLVLVRMRMTVLVLAVTRYLVLAVTRRFVLPVMTSVVLLTIMQRVELDGRNVPGLGRSSRRHGRRRTLLGLSLALRLALGVVVQHGVVRAARHHRVVFAHVGNCRCSPFGTINIL